jgi:hypothetical protein
MRGPFFFAVSGRPSCFSADGATLRAEFLSYYEAGQKSAKKTAADNIKRMHF